jgi:multiple sugar transport system permease protein
MLAGATITTLPVIALFAFIGRYFVAGLTAGAIK